jgi:hypothetical protein
MLPYVADRRVAQEQVASSSPGARSGFLPPIAGCCSSQVHRLGSLAGALLTSGDVRPFFSPFPGMAREEDLLVSLDAARRENP